MAIIASNPVTIPSATFSIWWIRSINIDNSNPIKPVAIVTFYLGDDSGKEAAGVPIVSYRVDIMQKITAGDTDLATLFGTLVAKAGAMAISDGKLQATVV